MTSTAQASTNRHSDTQKADPYRWASIGLAALMGCTLPVILALVVIAHPGNSPTITPVSMESVDSQSGALAQAQQLAAGREVFRTACAVCHGADGAGVPRLGKPLRNSAFVQGSSDVELFRLLAEGRKVDDLLNTTGALMPPRGASGLGDDQLRDVIALLRDMQDHSAQVVSVEAWDLTSEGGGGQVAIELDGHPGYQLFISSCAACHGEGAEGIEQLGLPLTTSGFVRGETNDGLVKFIKSGRPVWDANNTTGIDMPPKGGNPAITDEQLYQIVEYLRALQQQALASN
ncbi:MAG: c-type cytochrome [Phycisphaerales bacterium]|nr:c-type cytochrome [Phycisphaerales bacterium]